MKKLLIALALAAVLAAAAIYLVRTPYAGFREQVFVNIPKGTGTFRLARMLAGAGVLRYSWEFLLVRAAQPNAKLKAGEYLFKKPATPGEVFDRIARGDIFYYVLPVPEGNNTFDIAALLERERILPARTFLDAAHDPSLVRDLDPQAPTLEGYLFPDTYRLTRHTSAKQLCRMMTERFRKAWQQLGAPKVSLHDTVALASMIEKEAKLPEERPVIASVFLNRLRLGMPLQCDPTTIYAALIEERYRGTIHRSDLASNQAYNTYQHTGLPPGPIANPGLDSLKSALHPAQTGFLYFVARADGSGGHQFSKALAQHERAVQQYRRGLAAAQQAGGAPGIPGTDPAGRNHRNRVGGTARPARTNL